MSRYLMDRILALPRIRPDGDLEVTALEVGGSLAWGSSSGGRGTRDDRPFETVPLYRRRPGHRMVVGVRPLDERGFV